MGSRFNDRGKGLEWHVLLESYGSAEDLSGTPYLGRGRVWRSVTPYLHPWFSKKRFTVADQLLRECTMRGWPGPRLESLQQIRIEGRARRPVHFHRFRSKRGLRQPDTQGSFWRLEFPEPVSGPVALGFGCHFGLGLFARMENAD
jgi:CRISPR-associated protein Csb2